MENMEEDKIQDAEIVSENISEEKQLSEKKPKIWKKMAMIFVFGLLLGIALKAEALKKITIGYNDYLMNIKTQNYDINKMQADLSKSVSEAITEEGQADEESVESENIPAVPSDGQNSVQK